MQSTRRTAFGCDWRPWSNDIFKYQVDQTKPKSGRQPSRDACQTLAEGYLDDPDLLGVIELHDEAYNSWANRIRSGDWASAEDRARARICRLGSSLPFYVRFYRADKQAGSKSQELLEWFDQLIARADLKGP